MRWRCLFLLAFFPSLLRADASYDAWLKYRDQVRQDRSVIAYYTFEDAAPGAPIANERGPNWALNYSLVKLPNLPEQKLEIVQGRWPGKKAVRLDMGRLEGPEIPVLNKTFTAACWFRSLGPGVHKGNNNRDNGTILSVGVGYWDGWRVTEAYPHMRLGFEIGRPQPASSFGISGEPVSDGVWNHLAATWDGKEMRLYLNGTLLARGAYEGAYTPPPSDKHFRIGYAGYGWGSSILEVDEVIIYDRALDPAEVLQSIFFADTLSREQERALSAAEDAFLALDWTAAREAYSALHGDPAFPAGFAPLLALRLGQIHMRLHEPKPAVTQLLKVAQAPNAPEGMRATALAQLLVLARAGAAGMIPQAVWTQLLAMPGVTPRDRMQAYLQMGHALRREGKTREAQEQYDRALAVQDLPMRERLNARLSIAHACRADRDYEVARTQYLQVVNAAGELPEFRMAALFGIAECHAAQKRWDLAAAACEKAAAQADAPAHLREEARERQAEVAALKAGKRLPPRSRHVTLPTLPKPALELHVATDGNDENPGTIHRPLATLQAAQMAIRKWRGTNPLPAGGAVVYVHGGNYPCTASLALTAEDSGSAQAPIVYRNHDSEKPRFTGGVSVKGFVPVTDPAVLARLPEEARGKVLQADLKAQGITDLGKMSPRGMDKGTAPYTEVFWNGQPLRLGRWPNDGWLKVGPIISGGKGGQPTTFAVDHDRLARWEKAADPYVEGFWMYDWAEASLAVNALDPQAGTITINSPGGYGIRSGQRYFALNLLEEIDQPGEMYLDRGTGVLYVYPPSDPAQATVEFSTLNEPFVTMTDCSWTILQGLTFDICRGNAVTMKNGERNLVLGCTITRPGQTAVIIDGGHDCGVFGCDLGWMGRGGVVMTGGDRKTLTPGRHFVENCHIHDFSRIERSYTPAVLVNGVGNRIAHNLIHESPHHAFRIEGNDHVVEFNEIHSVVYEGDDQSGLDIWGNPTYWGNVFRYNFWHHIGSGVACGQGGIRLDDAISGVLMYGNIFYKCSEANFGAIQIHGGKDNICDNNLFIDCKYGISFSGWGQKRWEEALAGTFFKPKLEEVNAFQPPYSERYPGLLRIKENADVNHVWRNVAVNCGSFLTRDRGIQQMMDNLVLAEDPGFIEPEAFNFSLKPTSSVFAMSSFRRIPVEEIGLYRHPLRASWPVRSEISPNFRPLPN